MQKDQNDEVVSMTVPVTKATWIKPEIDSLDLGGTDGKFIGGAESSTTTGPS
ncbi:hypothetical protein ACNH6B_13745 [Shewanella basaltis]|uniref:hypothetical protein n=1 Tax=Shewanella basaltis TaxID=472183 RepID=UPI003AAC92E9